MKGKRLQHEERGADEGGEEVKQTSQHLRTMRKTLSAINADCKED
jgi:RecA/RadA recombinase